MTTDRPRTISLMNGIIPFKDTQLTDILGTQLESLLPPSPNGAHMCNTHPHVNVFIYSNK